MVLGISLFLNDVVKIIQENMWVLTINSRYSFISTAIEILTLVVCYPFTTPLISGRRKYVAVGWLTDIICAT